MKVSLLLACCFAGCASTALALDRAPPSPSAAVTSESASVMTADTPRVTAAGHAFVAPAGWSVHASGRMAVLTVPEGGSRIAIVDVDARDADGAVAAAWAAFDAKAKWPLKQSGDRPPRNGWEQVRSYRYAMPATSARAVSAQALRHGQRWTVVILDMAQAVAEKRDGQVELVYQRLWSKGYTPESFAGKTAHALDAARVRELTRFIDDARRTFDVPGVAIGIVQGGKVVFAGGFGVRQVGKSEVVDAETLFMIASNNKALTTLMLAKLVDAGKFTWETPVTDVWPSFKLGDVRTTRQVRMKHLVCACTGMPRQDMETLLQGEDATPASLMAMLATMQPTSPFGELYQYSNLMASAAGFAGGHVYRPDAELGAAYDAAMQDLVFDPLGMRSTTFDFDRALRGNHASPHARDVDGKTALVDMAMNLYVIPNRPNGGAWSNVNDMLRYVRMELAKGRLADGAPYIGEAPLLERYVQQVATGSASGYGMGLKLDRSWGIPVVNHGGIEAGYRSDMVWLPDHDVGAVILTNADEGVSLRYAFRRRLVELLFDGKPEAAENVRLQAKRLAETQVAERAQLDVPADAEKTDKLAKRYRNPELGDIDVSRKGSQWWFDFGGWKSEVTTRTNDDGALAYVTISPGARGYYRFLVNDAGAQRSLVLRDAQHEYVFTAVE